jgi:hypothetical protein
MHGYLPFFCLGSENALPPELANPCILCPGGGSTDTRQTDMKYVCIEREAYSLLITDCSIPSTQISVTSPPLTTSL